MANISRIANLFVSIFVLFSEALLQKEILTYGPSYLIRDAPINLAAIEPVCFAHHAPPYIKPNLNDHSVPGHGLISTQEKEI